MLLNAVMCVWNEEDVIASTIKHALAQGCSNVFIVDNGSTDHTVDLAVKAGGILAASFESKYFDEIQKIAYLNTVVRNYNFQSDEKYIWWLYIDADEFPNIDFNITILDFLKTLDVSVRAVHGYMFNHIPTHPPYYVSGYHPVDFMPICTKSTISKIPLLRYDKGEPHLYSAGGAHTFDTGGNLIPVVKDALNIHHFYYRQYEHSKNRLRQLCQKRPDGTSRVDRYAYRSKFFAQSEDAQSEYTKRLDAIKSEYEENKYKSLLSDFLVYNYQHITRWYDQYQIHMPGDDEFESILAQAVHYLFLGNHDLALCKFNDLIQLTDDSKLQSLIVSKIALCLSSSSKNEALVLLKSLLRCEDVEVRSYVANLLAMINEDRFMAKNESDKLTFEIQNYYGHFENKVFID